VTWERRLAPAFIGSVAAAGVAALLGALTHPFAEVADAGSRHGSQAGLVVRYAFLGAFAGVLIDVVARGARRAPGGLRAVLTRRGNPAAAAVALLGVAVLAIVPAVVGGYSHADFVRDQRAGFLDGCARQGRPADYCACIYDQLGPQSQEQIDRVVSSRRPPRELQRAANACIDLYTP
jgi:hypothetical protein